jgi:hypothetical protein
LDLRTCLSPHWRLPGGNKGIQPLFSSFSALIRNKSQNNIRNRRQKNERNRRRKNDRNWRRKNETKQLKNSRKQIIIEPRSY